jgi:CheY-like chemotaxis protein
MKVAPKPISVLITDDESNIRLLIRTALETEGYSVSEAANGREALDAVRRLRPDLMILDLNMPVLDGMAVLEQMKLISEPRPRVVVLTAYGSIPTAVHATRLGAADFLEKPVTPADLRKCLLSLMTEPDPQPAVAQAAEPPGGYDTVLERVRKALRLMNLADAEALLMAAAERRDQQSAAYFNLLGILYESQHRWRLARKCFGKALDADERYEPARTNFRRLDEMHRYGKTERRVILGDEPEQLLIAELPEGSR